MSALDLAIEKNKQQRTSQRTKSGTMRISDFLPEGKEVSLPGGLTKNFFCFQDKNLHDSYTQDLAITELTIGFPIVPFSKWESVILLLLYHCLLDV